ncbi:hypothetical protein BC829DRAFT_418564 [Chytridium lagenaria]|nr:hypothetical protein BC829DRAFT_418564 [Chytridium lagenaria]
MLASFDIGYSSVSQGLSLFTFNVANILAELETSPSVVYTLNNASRGSSRAMTMCLDYHCRPEDLNDVWWAAYGEKYEIVDHKSTSTSAASPQKTHPKWTSKRVVLSMKRKMLMLTGIRLPDINDNTLPDTDRELYYKICSLLFRPHRTFSEIIPAAQTSWFQEYTSWKAHNPNSEAVKDACLWEATNSDFYRPVNPSNTGMSEEEELLLRRPLEAKSVYVEDTIGAHLPYYNSLSTSLYGRMRGLGIPRSRPREPLPELTASLLETMLADTANTIDSESSIDTHSGNTPVFSSLEILDSVFDAVPWIDPGEACQTVDALLPYPSISQVSMAYTLRFWQHVVFEHFARRLLQSFADSEGVDFTRNPSDSTNHSIMLACGLAGSGKSQVIMALLKFVTLWGRRSSIETTSFTGTAAMNIQGQTMHSLHEASMIDVKLFGAFEVVVNWLAQKTRPFPYGWSTRLIFGDSAIIPVAGTPFLYSLMVRSPSLMHRGWI